MSRDDIQEALEGTRLSAAEVRLLESNLQSDPADIDSRLRLLGYLSKHRFEAVDLVQKWTVHALWFIQHEPEREIVGSPFCKLLPNDPNYREACDIWDRTLEQPDVSPGLLLNAARFFTLDRERAQRFLDKGELLAPSWPDWAEYRGQILLRKLRHERKSEKHSGKGPSLSRRDIALRALGHFKRALDLSTTIDRQFEVLPKCAEAAFEAEEYDSALGYAEGILKLSSQCPQDRHRPDRVHVAHIVRGHVTLNSGDVSAASEELGLAGEQGSSQAPVLRSFGPDFSLAQRLLERGERTVVLSYLDRCSAFWDKDVVSAWRAEIERGGVPLMIVGNEPR